MVYTDEHGYERWRILTHEERNEQSWWEQVLEYTDAFTHYHRIRPVTSDACRESYWDTKHGGIYFRKFSFGRYILYADENVKHPDIGMHPNKMAPIGVELYRGAKNNQIAFAMDLGSSPYSARGRFYNLVQIDPSIKAEEAMACIAARRLEMGIELMDPVYSPLERLKRRIENKDVKRPIRANFNAQRCKDEFERRHYTQVTIKITCTDDKALERLKERVPTYDIWWCEHTGRRMLELAVPRLGLERVIPGPIRWAYDGESLIDVG